MHGVAIVDEAELGHLARLVARLTPAQQRLVVALADGIRGGWLEPFQWERAWRGSDLDDDGVVGDARPGWPGARGTPLTDSTTLVDADQARR
jgi:hypothetical protein